MSNEELAAVSHDPVAAKSSAESVDGVRRSWMALFGLGAAVAASACSSKPGEGGGDGASIRTSSTASALTGSADVVDTMASLRGHIPTTSPAAVTLAGYRTPGDGGGGVFVWDPSTSLTDDGGTIIVVSATVGGPSEGTWRRVYDGAYVSVKWFGAMGDGSMDDSGAINAAIQSLPATGGGVVFVPNGKYSLSSSINIINAHGGPPDYGDRAGIQLVGEASLHGDDIGLYFATTLMWNGPSTDPIIRLYSCHCVVKDLIIISFTATPCAIDIDDPRTALPSDYTVPDGAICTNNRIENVHIDGRDPYFTITNGVRIGLTSSMNVEYMALQNVKISSVTNACVYMPNDGMQSKHNVLYSCTLYNSTYGIFVESGSISTFNCGFSKLGTILKCGSLMCDFILICNSDSEACGCLIDSGGASDNPRPVSVIGGRFSLDAHTSATAVYNFISVENPGPLTLQGVSFEGQDANFRIYVTALNGVSPSVLNVMGCNFPSLAPFSTDANMYCRLNAIGNMGCDLVTTFCVPLDDVMADFGGPASAVHVNIGAARLRNPARDYSLPNYFDIRGVSTSEQIFHHDYDSYYGEARVLEANAGRGLAFGAVVSDYSSTPQGAGVVTGVLGGGALLGIVPQVYDGGPALVMSAFCVGGHPLVGGGARSSLIVATPQSQVPYLVGYGGDAVDLGTFASDAEGNPAVTGRPAMRYTAEAHTFRVDSSGGNENPGTTALAIDTNGSVFAGTAGSSSSGYAAIPCGTDDPSTAPSDLVAGFAPMYVNSSTGTLWIYMPGTGWTMFSHS